MHIRIIRKLFNDGAAGIRFFMEYYWLKIKLFQETSYAFLDSGIMSMDNKNVVGILLRVPCYVHIS
ncbi:MAG: hypothetical protein A2091_03650 [Desulfuromonadales bacterium GWD2_61_12]|nr:MAG: hypothetical protein A2005_06550 [Desulfuromonadales bacterium GWC2_61_20]OGR35904.1 MAG: hypothetical protein A2091_03650 [Desulfuromonadales bacterium GWD2_61_12]